ncbi:hypothetical protein BB560_002873 [Smittium megazygosporum]|uniref:Uncharacterized protein n=1 Tax=Smittium megazygosporum TaxID=133381 RepID=A0A2T9ZDK4_9FUNG|nr:hypothetical protein BB560_002873 [Smittium megazygosporum]
MGKPLQITTSTLIISGAAALIPLSLYFYYYANKRNESFLEYMAFLLPDPESFLTCPRYRKKVSKKHPKVRKMRKNKDLKDTRSETEDLEPNLIPVLEHDLIIFRYSVVSGVFSFVNSINSSSACAVAESPISNNLSQIRVTPFNFQKITEKRVFEVIKSNMTRSKVPRSNFCAGCQSFLESVTKNDTTALENAGLLLIAPSGCFGSKSVVNDSFSQYLNQLDPPPLRNTKSTEAIDDSLPPYSPFDDASLDFDLSLEEQIISYSMLSDTKPIYSAPKTGILTGSKSRSEKSKSADPVPDSKKDPYISTRFINNNTSNIPPNIPKLCEEHNSGPRINNNTPFVQHLESNEHELSKQATQEINSQEQPRYNNPSACRVSGNNIIGQNNMLTAAFITASHINTRPLDFSFISDNSMNLYTRSEF